MTAMGRVRQLGSVLLSFGLAVTVGSPASATPESGAGQTPATAAPQPAAVQWSSCEGFVGDTADIPGARCTTVAVPVDYDNPGGPHAHLAMIRIPATGQRLGSLLVNPGGPGASAVDSVAAMGAALAGSPVNEHLDLVGFDPRGVGHSTPEVRCRSDAEFDDYRRDPMVDYSPTGVTHIEKVYQQLAQRCVDRMGPT